MNKELYWEETDIYINKKKGKMSLKPCPFCGGTECEIRTDDDGNSYYVFCPECGASVGYSLTADECGLAWNMRVCEG